MYIARAWVLGPMCFAGFLIKWLHVHRPTPGFRPDPPPFRFAWLFARRLGSFFPWGAASCVFCPSFCPCFMSTAASCGARCGTAVFAIWDISARGVPFPVLSQYYSIFSLPPGNGRSSGALIAFIRHAVHSPPSFATLCTHRFHLPRCAPIPLGCLGAHCPCHIPVFITFMPLSTSAAWWLAPSCSLVIRSNLLLTPTWVQVPSWAPSFWSNFWLFASLRLRSDIRNLFLSLCPTPHGSHSNAPQAPESPSIDIEISMLRRKYHLHTVLSEHFV
jgi:hypothetical protein